MLRKAETRLRRVDPSAREIPKDEPWRPPGYSRNRRPVTPRIGWLNRLYERLFGWLRIRTSKGRRELVRLEMDLQLGRVESKRPSGPTGVLRVDGEEVDLEPERFHSEEVEAPGAEDSHLTVFTGSGSNDGEGQEWAG